MEGFPTDPEFLSDSPETRDIEAQLMLFAHSVEAFQEPNWAYHNWEWHIKSSFAEAMRLCDEYDQKKETDQPAVNRLVVGLAILSHDSGYSHYNTAEELKNSTGFESKEAYSCHIAEQTLLGMGYEQEIIDDVKACIGATQRGTECLTIESWLVRRADLFNIASDYEYFKTATTNFRDEIAMLSGKKHIMSLGEFMCLSWPVLRDYIQDDYNLWPGDKHPLGHSKFYVNTCLNVYRLLIESGVGVTVQLTNFIKDLPSKVRS